MKKIAFLLGFCFLGYLLNIPDDMPQSRLALVKNSRVVESGVAVGGACKRDKCLVIYVAPWCPSCKALTPMINDLVAELKDEGIPSSVVIGKDSRKNVFNYAKRYKVPVLFDENSDFYRESGIKGVPYFAVSNAAGKRIKVHTGGYMTVGRMRDALDI